MRKGDDTMRMKMMAGAALCASTLAFAAPVAATVVPGDTFSVAIAGFNLEDINDQGIILVGPLSVTFGQPFISSNADDVLPGAGPVTVTSSETIGATTTTDTISIFVPTNFIPANTRTVSGNIIDYLEFDLGAFNADANGLDFLQPISGAVFSGDLIYALGTFALDPDVTLSANNTSLTMFEFATSGGVDFSTLGVRRFDFSVTYATPATPSVPEPASWALMVAGFGAVGYAMRRAVRRSDIRFDDRIRRITAGEIA